MPSATWLLSRMAGLAVFAPAINADIAMLNLIACIADETKRRRAFAASGTPAAVSSSASSSSLARKKPLLTLAQKAIVVGTCISIFGDLIILYTCVHSNLNNSWPDFSKWMAAFNVVKRIHSIIAIHITFLRLQIVTGRFKPTSSPRSRQRGATRRRTTWDRITSNMPALVSTTVYSFVAFVSVGFQLHAYFSNHWDSKASRDSQSFQIYRIINLAGTSYFALIALYTDTALISLSTKLYEAAHTLDSIPLSVQPASGPGGGPLSPALSVENLNAAASNGNTTPFSTDPLKRVKKYYNHWINLGYEVLLFVTYVALSVAYFFDSDFIAAVFVEQALFSFVALNGYVLLHATLKEAEAGLGVSGGNSSGASSGPDGRGSSGRTKAGGDAEPRVDDGFLFGSSGSARPLHRGDDADEETF